MKILTTILGLLVATSLGAQTTTTIDALAQSLTVPVATDLFIVSDGGITKKMNFSVLHDGLSGGHTYDGGPAAGNTLTLRGNPFLDGLILLNPAGGDARLGGTSLTADVVFSIKTGAGNAATLRLDTGAGQQWRIRGDGTTSDLIFRDQTTTADIFTIQNAAAADSLTIEATTGDIGMGTTSPDTNLHILSTANVLGKVETSAVNGLANWQMKNDAQTWSVGVNADDDFKVGDVTFTKDIFLIQENSRASSMVIETVTGDIGIGTINTDSPAVDFHLSTDDNPEIRIESNQATQTAQLSFKNVDNTWTIGNNGAATDDFHIEDTTGATVPFVIEGGAAASSLYIDTDGDVAIPSLAVGVTGASVPTRPLWLTGAMHIVPQASPPASPVNGDIYVDSTGGQGFCIYLNGAWLRFAGTGACA